MRPTTLAAACFAAAMLAGLQACTDTPLEVAEPAGAAASLDPTDLENQYQECYATSISVYTSADTVAVGDSVGVIAFLSGRNPVTNQVCSPDPTIVGWSLNNPQLGYFVYGWGGYTTLVGSAPGSTIVVGSAPSSGISYVYDAAPIIVIPAAPTLGSISGLAQVTVAGSYDFQVAASGAGPTFTYEWQTSTNGGATWTSLPLVTVGATSTQAVPIPAGAVTHLRVRAKTGNSRWSAFSSVHAVDAIGAAPPISVWISGYDNIRSYGTHYFEAMPSGGNGTYSYHWTFEHANGTSQTMQKQFFWTFGPCDGEEVFPLTLTVTSGTASVSTSLLLGTDYQDQC